MNGLTVFWLLTSSVRLVLFLEAAPIRLVGPMFVCVCLRFEGQALFNELILLKEILQKRLLILQVT